MQRRDPSSSRIAVDRPPTVKLTTDRATVEPTTQAHRPAHCRQDGVAVEGPVRRRLARLVVGEPRTAGLACRRQPGIRPSS
jgi:hypothetical protein